MKIGIIIYSNDPETVWNAFRFANSALQNKDEVRVFLLAKGVECESLDTEKFKITGQIKLLVDCGGEIFACGTCLKIRHSQGSKTCPLSSIKDLHKMVKECDKIISF